MLNSLLNLCLNKFYAWLKSCKSSAISSPPEVVTVMQKQIRNFCFLCSATSGGFLFPGRKTNIHFQGAEVKKSWLRYLFMTKKNYKYYMIQLNAELKKI